MPRRRAHTAGANPDYYGECPLKTTRILGLMGIFDPRESC